MSLSQQDIDTIAALNTPILCVDTCTLLDVIRDITRETVNLGDAIAGISLLKAAETGHDLIVLIAEQVTIELAANIGDVEDEANRAVLKLQSQLKRIYDVTTAYGTSGNLNASCLNGHVSTAKTFLNRWTHITKLIPNNSGISSRALHRVNLPRTPARKGKESMKDCVVIETYLEATQQLRTAGLTKPIVFASSNTREYYAPNTKHLAADINSDFSQVGIGYAPSFGAAKHILGL